MITITNNNIYYSDFSLYYYHSLNGVEVIDDNNIVNFFAEFVELGESVTFKRLIDLISLNIEKFYETFYSCLRGFPLDPYLQEIENNPTEDVEFSHLEIYWSSEIYKDELTIIPSLHGVPYSDDDLYYAIDFTSLNNLKNYILKLNNNVEIYSIEHKEYGKEKDAVEEVVEVEVKVAEEVKKEAEEAEEVDNLLGKKNFTLFELYYAIFTEISFHGGPQDKKERLEEISMSVEETENSEEELISLDDLLEKLDSSDEYLVRYKDVREKVNSERVNNIKNLPKLKKCLLEKLKIYEEINNDTEEDLSKYYKRLTDNEYNMQLLYGEEEDIKYHVFWMTPKCTCPKIDNIEIYPSKTPIFSKKCPIHGKVNNK
jgi:hypothetical protein